MSVSRCLIASTSVITIISTLNNESLLRDYCPDPSSPSGSRFLPQSINCCLRTGICMYLFRVECIVVSNKHLSSRRWSYMYLDALGTMNFQNVFVNSLWFKSVGFASFTLSTFEGIWYNRMLHELNNQFTLTQVHPINKGDLEIAISVSPRRCLPGEPNTNHGV